MTVTGGTNAGPGSTAQGDEMAQLRGKRTLDFQARVTITVSCSYSSFLSMPVYRCVERRRHCRLTDPNSVPLPGPAIRMAASLDAHPHVSAVSLVNEATSATGDVRTPAATATIGRARPNREWPRPARLFGVA
jgi:hypothetical protein